MPRDVASPRSLPTGASVLSPDVVFVGPHGAESRLRPERFRVSHQASSSRRVLVRSRIIARHALEAGGRDPQVRSWRHPFWTEYTAFLEGGCDAALFVGMHARAGTADGVMNHTISGRDYQNLWFNDTLVGETGINAALCGTWGCPVLLVTGDDASCREARELLGEGLTTVAVKWGLGAESARSLTPARARELIEEGARRALSDLVAVRPYDPGRPCEVKAEFKNTDEPDRLRHRHGVERLGERTIVSRADTWWDAWRQFYF
jgi:D-amino peptidase